MKSKVLLIDDSVTIHRVIDLSIDFDRYDIVKVFSKEDAVLKLQSEQFDYILLDNKLDNIVISEYISELKQMQKSATIILLVGAFDRFDEKDLERTKADDYLVKPFDSQSLNEKLSSEADMMPAGIVERIAEADFARDNDDFTSKKEIKEVTSQSSEGITKEEYLKNLEEVALDDLTDKGYIEDFEQAESTNKENIQSTENAESTENVEIHSADNIVLTEQPVEEQLAVEQPVEEFNSEIKDEPIIEPVNQDASLTAVNNMVSLNDLDEDEDNEDDYSYKDDDMPLSSIELDEPLNVEKSSELLENENDDFNKQTDEPVNEIPQVDDFSAVTENVSDEAGIHEEKPLFDDAAETPVPSIEPALDMNQEPLGLDNISHPDESMIEIPDPMKSIRNPILPGIDDAASIPDEYLMQENLSPADNSGADMLHEFPDFPDVDEHEEKYTKDNNADTPVNFENENTEIENKEDDFSMVMPEEDMQSEVPVMENQPAPEEISVGFDDADNKEETLINSEQTEATAEENVTPLFDDDDWLSDAPGMEKPVEENKEENESSFDFDSDTNIENIQEEPVNTSLFNEEVTQDISQEIDEQMAEETFVDEQPLDENQSYDIGIDEPSLTEEKEEDMQEVSSEEIIEDMKLFEEEQIENEQAEQLLADDNNAEIEDLSSSEELQAEENKWEEKPDNNFVAPVVNQVEQSSNTQEVRKAEAYMEENTGRFGGITVTISRDEIMSMLGNAIDKHFLEEAVKEVIAANMKDIVQNIVPAIAEKYIKEEIERLKNDE